MKKITHSIFLLFFIFFFGFTFAQKRDKFVLNSSSKSDRAVSFPWAESFEGSFLPPDWTKIVYSGNDITQNDQQSHDGNYSARFSSYDYSSNYNQYLFSPSMTIDASYTQLTFWHRKYTSDAETLEWGIGTTLNPDDYTWTSVNLSHTEWQETVVDLSAYVGQTVYIAWHYYGNYLYYVYLDDVEIDIAPSCLSPTDQTATNNTTTGADLGWTDTSGTHWDLYITATGNAAPESGTTPTINDTQTSPYTWTGGDPGTYYDFYVRSDCGQDNFHVSSWVGPFSFNTSCNSTTVPYFENFDNITVPFFPACMYLEDTNDDVKEWETSDVIYLSSPNSAVISYNPILAMNDWFFTQGLQLSGGTTYQVSFAYRTSDTYSTSEKLEVDWGTAPNSSSMSGTPIFNNDNITTGWYIGNGTFSPSVSGTYYVGFHGYSDADMFYLSVDDIKIIPVVDATTWEGTIDNDWDNQANWLNGLPSATTDVTIPVGKSNYPTVEYTSYIGSLTIESNATGDGSLIGNGKLLVNGSTTIQRYISGEKWHGICSPVENATAQSLFSNTANVYLKEHSESTNAYSPVTELTTTLDDMKGWMMWYSGAGGESFNIDGDFRPGSVVGSDNNLIRTNSGTAFGWNFVGNPFSSTIDWNNTTGWVKTNINSTIYLYNNGNWATWNGTTGTNGGSQYIAMGQGFFVEVTDGGGPSTGTLMMNGYCQVHNPVTFLKKTNTNIKELVRLSISNGEFEDETLIYFHEYAKPGFDPEFDAHKLFSFDENRPQIFSTANDKMAVNVLPVENMEVGIDVVGTDGEILTISATEINGFGEVNILDEYTGIKTNLYENDYEFIYDQDFNNRFTLFFTTVTLHEDNKEVFSVYSYNKTIRVIIPDNDCADVEVYCMTGQRIRKLHNRTGIVNISVLNRGHYIVKVFNNKHITTRKVAINQ